MLKFLFIPLLLISCSKKNQPVSGQSQKLVEMTKSPCFGFCPVYRLVVFQDGLMRLEAKQNMKISGMFIKQLSTSEFHTLKTGMEKLKWEEFKEEYREPVADAPTTELTYFKSDFQKKIFTNFLFPAPLQTLTEELNQFALSENWNTWVDPRVRTEFIVLLKDGFSLSGLLREYNENELTMVKRLDPANGQYWLVAAMLIPGEENIFLAKLKKEPGVNDVQFNKSLDTDR